MDPKTRSSVPHDGALGPVAGKDGREMSLIFRVGEVGREISFIFRVGGGGRDISFIFRRVGQEG